MLTFIQEMVPFSFLYITDPGNPEFNQAIEALMMRPRFNNRVIILVVDKNVIKATVK